MGSIQRDVSFLEDTPSLKEMVLTTQPAPRMTPPFIGLRPANPAMQALTSQKRETHNRSPISFREGRRASDTSLTQGNKRAACMEAPRHPGCCAAHLALTDFLTRSFALLLYRNCSIQTAPPESGTNQRNPGTEQSPAAVRADGIGRRTFPDINSHPASGPRQQSSAGTETTKKSAQSFRC